MRSMFFVALLAVSLVGCAPVVATVAPQVPEPAQSEPEEVDEGQARLAELERVMWDRLDQVSTRLVFQTHQINTRAVSAAISDETTWRSAVWRLSRAVEAWLGGVDRLRQPYGEHGRLRALLSLESNLLDLEESLGNLQAAYAELNPESDAVEPSLIALRDIVTSARRALNLAVTRFTQAENLQIIDLDQ